MEPKVYYYIYKITILTGSRKGCYYIGQHKTDNIEDEYPGSGTILKNWRKSKKRIEGIDYIKEILCYCDTWEEMQEKEAFYVGNKWKSEYHECLNLQPGGVSAKKTEEIKLKIKVSVSDFMDNCPNKKEKFGSANIGRTPYNKGIKGVSEETSNKMSESAINRWDDNERGRESIRKKEAYKNDSNLSVRVSEGTKQGMANMSPDAKKRMIENGSKTRKGYIFMTDGTHKPIKVVPAKQQEYYNKKWYRCHRNSVIPWEEKVA